jgi:hypothetical protein
VLILGVAVALVACGTPVPSAPPSTAAPSIPASAASTNGTPTVAPVTPSPVAIEPQGVEVFSFLESGHWEMAASASNLGRVSQVSVLRALTDIIEVYAACSGTGTLLVQVRVVPPATEAPAPTSQPLTETTLTCPDPNGQSISLETTAPAGWFANVDAIPSDPSIKYEVLIGTVVD